MYGRIPMFPNGCAGSSNMCMPLFDHCPSGCSRACEDCQTVRIFNPACREEYVDVELCVDDAGNLSVCVRRPPRPCRPPRRKKGCCDYSPCYR